MGDLGLPGSVVEMPDEAPQKALWEVRKAGLNIMMSLKGDGKPVSFIEDCAVPLRAPGRVHRRADRGLRAPRHARHLVRACLGRHAARAADPRHAPDGPNGGAAKMRAIADEAAALVRKFKGAYSGEHGDGLCRGEWIAGSSARRWTRRCAPSSSTSTRPICSTRARSSTRRRWTTRRCSASRPATARSRCKPVFDWSAWNVQNDPVTEATTAPGTGGDATGGLAKAVEMCNNNGHCRKFDAGTMCPSYRVTRDEQHLTRGRANTLRLALSGQLGRDALHRPTPCTRRWTCASAARAASATARPASTWRR